MIIDQEVYLDHKVNDFLEHYGVKGMTWGVNRKESLTRIFRMESATTSKKERLQKAKKALSKDVLKKEPDRQNGSDSKQSSFNDFLTKIGGVRFNDIAAVE
jgi:hypothetical protein